MTPERADSTQNGTKICRLGILKKFARNMELKSKTKIASKLLSYFFQI